VAFSKGIRTAGLAAFYNGVTLHKTAMTSSIQKTIPTQRSIKESIYKTKFKSFSFSFHPDTQPGGGTRPLIREKIRRLEVIPGPQSYLAVRLQL
jgi:hypothetical protein